MYYYCFINGAVVADPEPFVKTAEEAETTSFFRRSSTYALKRLLLNFIDWVVTVAFHWLHKVRNNDNKFALYYYCCTHTDCPGLVVVVVISASHVCQHG